MYLTNFGVRNRLVPRLCNARFPSYGPPSPNEVLHPLGMDPRAEPMCVMGRTSHELYFEGVILFCVIKGSRVTDKSSFGPRYNTVSTVKKTLGYSARSAIGACARAWGPVCVYSTFSTPSGSLSSGYSAGANVPYT